MLLTCTHTAHYESYCGVVGISHVPKYFFKLFLGSCIIASTALGQRIEVLLAVFTPVVVRHKSLHPFLHQSRRYNVKHITRLANISSRSHHFKLLFRAPTHGGKNPWPTRGQEYLERHLVIVLHLHTGGLSWHCDAIMLLQ